MSVNPTGAFQGKIPGHEAGTVIQFYVEATDKLGSSATFPADGTDSRALLQVADGQGPLTPIDTLRIIIMQEELDRLFARENNMSNRFLPSTLVHNRTSFYDVDVRLIGSMFLRPNSGYKIRLHPDQSFYGVHDSLRLDLSGLPEIVLKQMVNRAGGGQTSMYDELVYLVMPPHPTIGNHTNVTLLNLARFENGYLEEQFINSSSGTKWKPEIIAYPGGPAGGDTEALKRNTVSVQTRNDDIGVSSDLTLYQGNDAEFYRPTLLIKNRRVNDRFDAMKKFAQAIYTTGDALFDAANEVMDVDLWMRHFANQSFFGNVDTYGIGGTRNLRLYQRPEDGKMIPFFWDADFSGFTVPIPSAKPSRLAEIRDFPHNLRLFWGHMLDYINRSFNEEYVSRWANHYGELAEFKAHARGGTLAFVGENSATKLTKQRTEAVLKQLKEEIPEVDFQITTQDGRVFNPDEDSVTIEGKGWVNVRKIRIAGSGVELDAFWPEVDSWQIELPLTPGANQITLEAIDFEGKLINTDTVSVVSTAQNPVIDSLRLAELHYNPGDATQAEQNAGFGNDDFEFVELVNIGKAAISLEGVQFSKVEIDGDPQGLEFDFSTSAVTRLEPAQQVIVVEDPAAFRLRYGDVPNVAGQWSGRLSNQSETITLTVNGTLVHRFIYQDDWYADSDGGGSSLVIVNPRGDLALWNQRDGWSPSGIPGGSPGQGFGRPGDANGDGIFNSADLTLVFQAGEYEDVIDGNSTFTEGDWNADGDFSSEDLVLAFIVGGYTLDATAVVKPSYTPLGVVDRVYSEPDVEGLFATSTSLGRLVGRSSHEDSWQRESSLQPQSVETLFRDDETSIWHDRARSTHAQYMQQVVHGIAHRPVNALGCVTTDVRRCHHPAV